jgi:molecular chaperone GrpE
MGNKRNSGEFSLDSSIPEDIIAAALRSVEKHEHRKREREEEENELEDGDTEEQVVPSDELAELFGGDDFSGAGDAGSEKSRTQPGADNPPPVDLNLTAHMAQLELELAGERKRLEFFRGRTVELTRDVERLELALAEKTADAQKTHERLLWAASDLENYKRRAARERQEQEKFGLERFIRELLPVIDNLERALYHARESSDIGVLREGVNMTLTQFHTCLRRFGTTRIEVVPGMAFDPTVHEAMMQEESSTVPANSVVREMQSGYLLQERLLRASLVSVARAPRPGAPPPEPVEIVDEEGEEQEEAQASARPEPASQAAETASSAAAEAEATSAEATPEEAASSQAVAPETAPVTAGEVTPETTPETTPENTSEATAAAGEAAVSAGGSSVSAGSSNDLSAPNDSSEAPEPVDAQ